MAESKHLTNEQVEREEWEVMSIDVRPTDKTRKGLIGGFVTTRFAYKEDIGDTFILYPNGRVDLRKYYPKHVERQIKSRIKEVTSDTSVKKVRKPREEPIIIKPIILTIKTK